MHRDSRGYGYRSYRQGGKVCREYLGAGPALDAIAFFDAIDAQERDEKRAAQRRERETIEASDRAAREFYATVTAIARAALEAHGYHQHKRGEWRKRRDNQTGVTSMAATKKRTSGAKPQKAIAATSAAALSKEQITELMMSAQKGDAKAARLLRALSLDDEKAPGLAKRLVKAFSLDLLGGDFRGGAMVARLAGENLLVAEAMGAQLRQMRDEIAGPSPSPLVLLLAERIAICWLDLHGAETCYNQSRQGMSTASLEYWEKSISRAQRRYLSAIKALADVRRLELPAVQINVGEKQVNIANAQGVPSMPSPGQSAERGAWRDR